jgi:quercetin dioxygenase-like cupin family protein
MRPFYGVPQCRGKGVTVYGTEFVGVRINVVNEDQLARTLAQEGFSHTFVWQDAPNASYPDHTHATETAHIILQGEMTLTVANHSRTYRSGERCDVPAGAVHFARIGPEGCRYLIGER